jgi:putative hydrolase of the HAD superfamily
MLGALIHTIGFDGDDTLWHSETEFEVTQAMFCDLLAPYVPHPEVDLEARLVATEGANLELFGYGVKAFTLSMIETALDVSEGQVPGSVIQTLLNRGKEMLAHPVDLLDGVAEVIDALIGRYRLVLITKGDLLHQESKVASSGLADRFDHVEIVAEKDPATYARILDRHGIDPAGFLMVGNSVRSDVLPVLAIGGQAVHVPYHVTWAHEHADHDGDVPTFESVRELPGWLATR